MNDNHSIKMMTLRVIEIESIEQKLKFRRFKKKDLWKFLVLMFRTHIVVLLFKHKNIDNLLHAPENEIKLFDFFYNVCLNLAQWF